MTDRLALQRLIVWASPAFPTGAFGYSAGLETAIADGRVRNRDKVQEWVCGSLFAGSMRNDALIVAAASNACPEAEALVELADLVDALQCASQRLKELYVTGNAFVAAARAWTPELVADLPSPCPYPVAFGAVCGRSGIGACDAIVAFLTAQVQTQVSVAVRLVPIGQTQALEIQSALEGEISRLAEDYAALDLGDLGAISIAADIAAQRHETLETRIFRS
ncbi:urease accessory protein UreF [Nitratireductor basaltis]|uniref:Urease accessory protein UreF n=1 Tax=Nitratireductor basaltis TaxID=472175 RepID=A0A084U536_9HYPH|nr:urease accessory UreF family protein [Nitratireductor basaltis]KFB08072.1 Urease accessory protein UreF [Nitratireductor basaltis]